MNARERIAHEYATKPLGPLFPASTMAARLAWTGAPKDSGSLRLESTPPSSTEPADNTKLWTKSESQWAQAACHECTCRHNPKTVPCPGCEACSHWDDDATGCDSPCDSCNIHGDC